MKRREGIDGSSMRRARGRRRVWRAARRVAEEARDRDWVGEAYRGAEEAERQNGVTREGRATDRETLHKVLHLPAMATAKATTAAAARAAPNFFNSAKSDYHNDDHFH